MALNLGALAALGGGLEGGLKQWSWQQEMGQKDRAQASTDAMRQAAAEFAQQKLELQQLLADQADTTKRDVAGAYERGRMERHDTPSGSVVAQQAGAGTRATQADTTKRDLFGMSFDLGNRKLDEQTREWDTASGNAKLGSDTTKRGQDVTKNLGVMRNTTMARGQDLGVSTAEANRASREKIAKMPARPGSGIGSTTNFYATPVTPNAPAPTAHPTIAEADKQQVIGLTNQVNTETNPAKKAALQKQLADLLAKLGIK